MSFTVEFDGVLNENTDVVQMTGSSSLFSDLLIREPVTGFYTQAGYFSWYKKHGSFVDDLWIYWGGVKIYDGFWDSAKSTHVSGIYTYYKGSQYASRDWGVSRTYYSTIGATITESIDQNGVVITGGFLGSTSIDTTQTGFNGASTISREFGLVVKHNGGEILRASYGPSAEIGESSASSVSAESVFTATNATLEVESIGLDTSHYIDSIKSKVIVEEHKE